MAGEAVPASGVRQMDLVPADAGLKMFLRAVRNALFAGAILLATAVIFEYVLSPAIASVQVEESVTSTIAAVALLVLPLAMGVTAAATLRPALADHALRAILMVVVIVLAVYGAKTALQYATQSGPFGQQKTLQFAMVDTPDGVLVESVEPGGAADAAGLMAGDVITAIRRDTVDAAGIQEAVVAAELDAPLRFRLLRDGEEMQLTARVTESASVNTSAIYSDVIIGLLAGVVIGLFWPANWSAYALLVASLLPLLAGYAWLIIATFSYRTEGLKPVDQNGNFGGFTLSNWEFLSGQGIAGQPDLNIWPLTFNSLVIAILMTVIVLLVASMAGYALSRMNFPGRRLFLSLTLILHGFPAVTLFIPIFLVLISISNVPLIGQFFGFNTLGGIALVMVAFELPLGIWLMKGFFDNVPWDMERSALIDGASRWRTFFEIILPQIRPGLLALGIFAFVSGWNTYLIPATYSIGTRTSNLPVLIRSLTGEVNPVNWNLLAAVGAFQLIPILIFFIFAQEYLLNIYAGGTKGSS